jgi:hypothetical protein
MPDEIRETPQSPMATPEWMSMTGPEYIGAIFETGRERGLYFDYKKQEFIVPCLEVTDKEQRRQWALYNMRVFSDGTTAEPESKWRGILDRWLTELRFAASRAPYDKDKGEKPWRDRIKEKGDVEEEVKAMMAVSASARAMETSSGSAKKYVMCIAPPEPGGRDPDLDKQDSWAEFLLHNDPEKLNTVIRNPLIGSYYKRLIEDAGIMVKNEWDEVEGEGWVPSRVDVDKNKAFRGSLVDYLSDGKKHSERFNDYITEVLLSKDKDENFEEVDDGLRWAAAKLACDAFLVDKFTSWQYQLGQTIEEEIESAKANNDKQKEEDLEKQAKKVGPDLKPSPGWGGDPLRSVIEPAFLLGTIKRVYQKEDRVILDMLNNAFRPEDAFPGKLKGKLLPPSMVVHLKAYARYSDAHWAFLGSSRGIGIPQWSKDTMASLSTITELLDQVYGTIELKDKNLEDRELKDKPKNIGKHIVGIMMARILECKALSTAIESARPEFREKFGSLFEESKGRPFYEVEQFIWGPHLDAKAGFLASLAGGRTRIVFRDNIFGAEKLLRETWEILSTNDQDPTGRGRAQTLRTIGFLLDVAQALGPLGGGRKR